MAPFEVKTLSNLTEGLSLDLTPQRATALLTHGFLEDNTHTQITAFGILSSTSSNILKIIMCCPWGLFFYHQSRRLADLE